MSITSANPSPCLVLTATIQVKDGMILTPRRDTQTRLQDYQTALARWLACPEVTSIVLVENSGFDLSAFAEMVDRVPGKRIELLSFVAPDFDGALGKGYGEMLCLQHCLENSRLLAEASRFLKVTGRYSIANAATVLQFIDKRRDADVICDMRWNLTWADSRAFGGAPEFLRKYLCPMLHELNDSRNSTFEHVLARASHDAMAHCGLWIPPPFPINIEGVSGSRGERWQLSFSEKMKGLARQALLAKTLSSGAR